MSTKVAPNHANRINLTTTLQVRIDLSQEVPRAPKGKLRLRGWLDARCRGKPTYDCKVSLSDYDERFVDKEKDVDFVVLRLTGIDRKHRLTLTLETEGTTRSTIFQGLRLEDLKEFTADAG